MVYLAYLITRLPLGVSVHSDGRSKLIKMLLSVNATTSRFEGHGK